MKKKEKNDKKETISAQVVLRPASGRLPDPSETITQESLSQYAPSASQAQQARTVFAEAGFEVGDVVGNSFAITAPVSTFEKIFGTRLKKTKRSVRSAAAADNPLGNELPLASLPKDLAESLIAVTFSPPPDFGPTSFM
jgi:hypothetical protein